MSPSWSAFFQPARVWTLFKQTFASWSSVKSSDFWREALSSVERLVEVPFCVKLADQTPPRLLTGVVDLLYRNSQGWHLVDYKTDQLPMETLCEQYGEQVRHYAAEWAKIK